MRRILISLILCAVAVAAAPATAKTPSADLKISPAKPIIDEDLKVSFTSTAALKTGYTYSVLLIGDGSCDSSVAQKIVKPPQKSGKRISVKFRPEDEIVSSNPEWCQGKWKLTVARIKGEKQDKKIASKSLRFLAKP